MDNSLHLALTALVTAAAGLRIVRAAQFGNLSRGRIFNHFLALDDVAIAQSHFAAGLQTEKFSGCVLQEIVLLDEQLAT